MVKNYYYSQLQLVMQILKETCKLLRRNKKIFLFILLVTMLFNLLLFLANIFSIISLLMNLSQAAISLIQIDPKAPEYLKQVFKMEEKTFLIILVEIFYILLVTMISLLSMVATIYVSGMSYLGKDITVKELCLKIKQIWVRPLITWFYAFLMLAGLFVLLLPEYVFLVRERGSPIMLAIGIVLFLFVAALDFYLALVSNVGLVTSVLDDYYGLKALGKAESLVHGKRLVGFILMLILMVPFNAAYLPMILIHGRGTVAIQFLLIFLQMTSFILMNIVTMMTYTVFYFECKESRGEMVELHEEMGYTQVSAIPLDV